MNAVEIEEAISQLAAAPFSSEQFPFAFLEAFNKATTIAKLKSGTTNKSDLGGVLQHNNIHLKVCPRGEVAATLTALRESPATTKHKAKFILATDGEDFQAENLVEGETIACDYPKFADYFGFFLPLAGITTVKQIRENAFDIKATARLNRLYIELIKDNPDWDTAERRQEMNHFMARLIFCFFAEDTNIFHSEGLFTQAVAQMSAGDASNTHEVLGEIFRAMATPQAEREAAKIRNWANQFPYANGGLFGDPHPLAPSPKAGEEEQEALSPLSRSGREVGGEGVPRFSKIARSYLLHIGNLDWTKINPDIFGSMIQAVADEAERGALGMHYTSVPNILKVLNPLFLDDLRAQLAAAGDNPRKLLNLRRRLAKIRVFDPACGSGNFLVIAYKEMRSIEAELNRRRGEADRPSEIPLTNFRGIEIRHFSCEIARLALIIAEYQCNVLYRGQQLALAEFLPLKAENWITCGNALRLDWLSICPPTGTGVKVQREDLDLWQETADQAEIEFENEGGETYICGNPPYQGSVNQTAEQKDDMANIFSATLKKYKDLDYVAAFMMKAARFNRIANSCSAFVTTNSITQGEQVAMLWPLIYKENNHIHFAYTSFRWSNLASHNAGVTCVIIGLTTNQLLQKRLFFTEAMYEVNSIGPYLIKGSEIIVRKQNIANHDLSSMSKGNQPTDGGNLIFARSERDQLLSRHPEAKILIRQYIGSQEFIRGSLRYCLWIDTENLDICSNVPEIKERIAKVQDLRKKSKGKQANDHADKPYQFVYAPHCDGLSILIPRHFSEKRNFLTVGLMQGKSQVIADSASAIYDATLVDFGILSSRLHLVWIATVCGKLETRYRYSNTLGWNTFPVPPPHP
ncbi:MAG: class I SAM-dependent DNA methyltransferase, partial [Prochlorothrix sp.]